ncbi:hypothetical protein [Dactylosporangium sp. CA-092794]|uniref:hypothetical protein n=1 Tax=Dactylosporangium sp. CA-092794 TaxID=3239929 RepID=UPI003D93C2D5
MSLVHARGSARAEAQAALARGPPGAGRRCPGPPGGRRLGAAQAQDPAGALTPIAPLAPDVRRLR